MTMRVVRCIHCGSKETVKMGYQKMERQEGNAKITKGTFQIEYVNKEANPETKRLIIKMPVNGSGIRDISRVLEISKGTVMRV